MLSPIVILVAIAGGIYALSSHKKISKRTKSIRSNTETFRRALTSGQKTYEDISMMTASQSESDKLITEQIFEAARKEGIDPYKELGIKPPSKVPNCMDAAIKAAEFSGYAAEFSGYASMIPGCGVPMGIDIHNQQSEPVESEATVFGGLATPRKSISHTPDFDLPVDYICPSKEFSNFILKNVEGLYAIGVYRMRGSRRYIAIAEIRMMNRALLVHCPKSSVQRIAEYCMQVIQYFINEDGKRGIYKVILSGDRVSPDGELFRWEKQKHVDTREQAREEVEEEA